MKLRIFLNWVSYISILSAIIFLVTYFYWSFYPYKTIVFQDQVFPIVNKTIKQGTFLQYTSRYCKYFNSEALVTRSFVDQLIFSMPSMITDRPMGCHTITVEVSVPTELPVGKFHLLNTYEIQVNPIRKVVIEQSTEEFTVVAH
jgi:hypothetical protein